MAERGAEAIAFSDLIEFEAFRRSVGMGLIYRGLESEFQRARQVVLNRIDDDNIQVDEPDGAVEAETPPTFETATMATTTYTRALIRGTSQFNVIQTMEGPGPSRLDANLMSRLATKMAIALDDQVFSQITGATYGSAASTGFVVPGVGQPFSGTNAYGLDRTTGRYKSKGEAQRSEEQYYQDLASMMGDAEFHYRNNDIMAGELIGDGQPTGFAFVGPPVIVRGLTEYAKREGVLDMRNSVGTEAVRTSGILSTMAYSGTISNVDILSTTALKPSGNFASVDGYFVPIGAAVIGGVRPMMWDFGRFGQGNTQGAAVARSTVIWPYFVGRHGQEYLGKVTVQAG